MTSPSLGINKAYGIRRLGPARYFDIGISIKEMIYIGDVLYVGGNDYPAETAGVDCIPVEDPTVVKHWLVG